MPVTKKTFVGGINQDSADFLMDPKEYLGALNIRFSASDNGEIGKVTNIEGNVEKNQTINSSGVTVSWSLPAGTNRTIGAYEDTTNRRMFWFNWNSNNNHAIYCYDNDDDRIYTVFQQSGSNTALTFQEDAFIHSIAMTGNLLYWTDNYNEPKRINVDAGIKLNHPTYSTSVSQYVPYFLKVNTGGSGYVNGTYTNVPLTGGSGSGALATVVVVGTVVDSVTVTFYGIGYTVGDTLSASNTNLGGTGSGLNISVTRLLTSNVLTVIKPQPWVPLTASKIVDSGFTNNFIRSEAFQFAYRFIYRDGEISTFSPMSKLIDYNTDTENSSGINAVSITIPTSQLIEQDVEKIEIAVKYMTGGQMFVFKTIESGFNTHNNGSPIVFNFYNDVIGVAVDTASATKQFDSVPLKSKALEIAKNRLFLGNNLDGYDTPSSTSLSIGPNVISTTTVIGKWYTFVYIAPGGPFTKYLLFIDNITGGNGYYEKNVPIATPPPYPTTATFSDYTYKGNTLGDLATSYGITVGDIVTLTYAGSDATVTGTTLAGISGKVVFKTESSYKAGIVFYDFAGRKSGVVTADNIKSTTSDRSYTSDQFVEKISWSLSNTNAVSQIPSWATHYSIVRTKSLRTSLFIQQIADEVKYITKDSAGAYQTPTTTYTADSFGVAVSVKSLYSIGMGYQYQEGDILKLYLSTGTTYRLRVKDTYSDFIITELANVGTNPASMFEVYSPFVQSDTEYFYEVGETYPVTNPGTVSRQFGTVSGFFTGDVSLLQRTVGAVSKWTENMSPNDKFWRNWYTDIGRVNIILTEGQVRKPVTISFSNVIVPGTKTNGLSTFDTLDQYSVPTEMGSISRLVFTSKTITEGTVMLAVGEQETASIYLGESQIIDNTGSSFLAKSTGVIGNLNVLKGSYGTIHPESVIEWQGSVVFYDTNKGCWVRYDLNGLSPISINGMGKYFRSVSKDILAYIKSPTQYNNLNPTLKLRVLGAIDPYNQEFIMNVPRMHLNPQNAPLYDVEIGSITTAINTTPPTYNVNISVIQDKVYTITAPSGVEVFYCSTKVFGAGANTTFVATGSTTFTITSGTVISGNIVLTEIMPNYYDLYDGTGGTWCYNPSIDKYTSKYSFRPDWFCSLGNRLVSFSAGKPYIHNGSINTFYGQSYDSLISGVHNEGGNTIKVYTTAAVEGDLPSRMHFRTEVPNLQSSDLEASEFKVREGVGYANILRDRLSPNSTGSYSEKLFKGDPVRGEVCRFTYFLYLPNTKKGFKFINIGFNPARGQSV